MITNADASTRAVRAVIAWHGDSIGSVGRRLGVTPETFHRRMSRGLTPAQLREVAALYGLDPIDLARGEVRLPTRVTHRYPMRTAAAS